MMKRASVDFHQSLGVDEEVAKTRLKHQMLLLQFLTLQKELVSKKRKLQTAKQKRDILLSETRFLRRRVRFLSKYHSLERGSEREVSHHQNTDRKVPEGGRRFIVHEPSSLKNPFPVLSFKSKDERKQVEKGEEEEQMCKTLRRHKSLGVACLTKKE